MAEEDITGSRLRFSPGLREALEALAMAGMAQVEGQPSHRRRIRGLLAERLAIRGNLEYLEGLESKRGGYTWHALLAGETPISSGGVRLETKQCIKLAGAQNDTTVRSWGGAVKGPDYAALRQTYPAYRYKIFHSFGNQERGTDYLVELIRSASKMGLSMTMKTFDHAYDGANVYTYHWQQMTELVEKLYPTYADAFMSTEHFLQGPLSGVDRSHIGWVQEPTVGSIDSHSTRMRKLGLVLDQQGLNESAYLQGCYEAGVLPASPWLLNEISLDRVAEASRLHR